MPKIVSFGEALLRLKSPGKQRFLQTPVFEATFGGGELNVAVGLARFGLDISYVTLLPDNPIGDACVAEIRRQGIDVSHIVRKGDRMGIYFLEAGSGPRPSRVIYDRAHSAISEIEEDDIEWERVFEGASWFHVTGITPAISSSAARAVLNAVRAAGQCGLSVSCDLNFRKKLWKYGKSAPEVMTEIMGFVDVAIGNEEDVQNSLGVKASIDVESGILDPARYKKLTDAVLERFSSVKKIAVTLRESHTADYNGWQAVLNNRKDFLISKKYDIIDIEDRVGSGDSFASGLIFGLITLEKDREALEFAAAAGCLKHTVPGDLPFISTDEVRSLLSGQVSGRVQR